VERTTSARAPLGLLFTQTNHSHLEVRKAIRRCAFVCPVLLIPVNRQYVCPPSSLLCRDELASNMKNMKALQHFWQDESGQDLIEYSLLMAFLAVASIGILSGARNAVNGIWHTANADLVTANTVAAS